MIYFDTSDWELCNYILHRFFDVEGMSISASLEDKIVKIVPLFFIDLIDENLLISPHKCL